MRPISNISKGEKSAASYKRQNEKKKYAADEKRTNENKAVAVIGQDNRLYLGDSDRPERVKRASNANKKRQEIITLKLKTGTTTDKNTLALTRDAKTVGLAKQLSSIYEDRSKSGRKITSSPNADNNKTDHEADNNLGKGHNTSQTSVRKQSGILSGSQASLHNTVPMGASQTTLNSSRTSLESVASNVLVRKTTTKKLLASHILCKLIQEETDEVANEVLEELHDEHIAAQKAIEDEAAAKIERELKESKEAKKAKEREIEILKRKNEMEKEINRKVKEKLEEAENEEKDILQERKSHCKLPKPSISKHAVSATGDRLGNKTRENIKQKVMENNIKHWQAEKQGREKEKKVGSDTNFTLHRDNQKQLDLVNAIKNSISAPKYAQSVFSVGNTYEKGRGKLRKHGYGALINYDNASLWESGQKREVQPKIYQGKRDFAFSNNRSAMLDNSRFGGYSQRSMKKTERYEKASTYASTLQDYPMKRDLKTGIVKTHNLFQTYHTVALRPDEKAKMLKEGATKTQKRSKYSNVKSKYLNTKSQDKAAGAKKSVRRKTKRKSQPNFAKRTKKYQGPIYKQKLRPARDKRDVLAMLSRQSEVAKRHSVQSWVDRYHEPAMKGGARWPQLRYGGRIISHNATRSVMDDCDYSDDEDWEQGADMLPSVTTTTRGRGRGRHPSHVRRNSNSLSRKSSESVIKAYGKTRKTKKVKTKNDKQKHRQRKKQTPRRVKFRSASVDSSVSMINSEEQLSSIYTSKRRPNRYTKTPGRNRFIAFDHVKVKGNMWKDEQSIQSIDHSDVTSVTNERNAPQHKPLRLKLVRARVGSLENVTYRPKKTRVRIYNKPMSFNRHSLSVVATTWDEAKKHMFRELQEFKKVVIPWR